MRERAHAIRSQRITVARHGTVTTAPRFSLPIRIQIRAITTFDLNMAPDKL